LDRPRTRDQRTLDRKQRFANMSDGFCARKAAAQRDVVLIDDVYTTGATLCAATDALLDAGAACVRCATFTHVY
jgi:predicted amidophosphoribosyltransferase